MLRYKLGIEGVFICFLRWLGKICFVAVQSFLERERVFFRRDVVSCLYLKKVSSLIDWDWIVKFLFEASLDKGVERHDYLARNRLTISTLTPSFPRGDFEPETRTSSKSEQKLNSRESQQLLIDRDSECEAGISG